jgi:hypothetical protein
MKKVLIKISLLAIFGCLLQHYSYAQNNTDNVKVSESRTIQGIINPLSETQTWSIVLPDKLQYWTKEPKNSKPVGGFYASLPSYTEMKAKELRKGETPDFTFTVITEGIKNIKRGEPINHPKGGKVVEFTFTFPCLLQVSDKEGNIIKVFELSNEDEIMTATIHPTFLNDAVTKDKTLEIPVVSGFMQNDVNKYVDANLNAYLVRIEYNSYYTLVNRALQVITYGYGYPKIVHTPLIVDLNKKEKAKFPELNEQIEKLKIAVNEMFTAPFNDDVRNRLLELGEYFALNYTADSPKDAKRLYAFNAGISYLLGGNSDEAYKHYKVFDPLFGLLSVPPSVFVDMYPKVTYMNNLYAVKDEKEIGALPPVYSPLELKEMEEQSVILARTETENAQRQELISKNINKEQGFLITKDGEKVEGKISIDFIDLSPGKIVDMDLGKVVWVETDNGRKSFRPKNVSYVMAGDKRFEPATILENAGVKLLSAVLAGNFGGSTFMEVVHTNGNCSALFSQMANSYYVKSNLNEKVITYREILNAKKNAEKYFNNNCPELLARLRAKEFTSTKESLISFIDELSACTDTK